VSSHRHSATVLLLGLLLSSVPALGADSPTAQARELFTEAQKQFDLGNWEAAIQGFAKAYELRPDPTFLYNMAQAYRRGDNPKRAIDLYKNYLIKDPKSPQRAEVEEKIRILQLQVDEAGAGRAPAAQGGGQAAGAPAALAPRPAEPVAAQASPPPTASDSSAPANPPGAAQGDAATASASLVGVGEAPSAATAPVAGASANSQSSTLLDATNQAKQTEGGSRRLRIAGLVVGAVGIASALAGVFFSYRTHSLSSSVSDATQFNYADAQAGKNAEIAQWVCYAAGGALAATGAVLYWRGRATKGHTLSVGVSPLLAATGAGLIAAGSFR